MTATPPGPKGHFLLGNSREYRSNPLEFWKMMTSTYGDIASFRIGPVPAAMVNHPDYFQQILVTDAAKFPKSAMFVKITSRFIGTSVFNTNGDAWRAQRKVMTPAFHYSRIQTYAETMVNYTRRLMDEWADGRTEALDLAMMRLTLNIVTKTLFNADVGANIGQVDEAMAVFQEIFAREIKSPSLLPDWIPTQAKRDRETAVGKLDSVILRIIEERRRQNTDYGDLLSMLMQTQYDDGSTMSDRQVRDEALTLFIAGHETTANALVWTLYLLSQHPQVEAKLLAEIDRVLGGRTPTVADLPALEYTEMVIKEAMRLYPPAWQTSRQAAEDIQMGSYTLKKGTVVFLSPYMAHHDPRWWSEPETFKPERFAKGQEETMPKYAYWPFGGGQRVCIGLTFAMMEAKLILASLLQRYRFDLAPGQQIELAPLLTLKAKNGLKMIVRQRVNIPAAL